MNPEKSPQNELALRAGVDIFLKQQDLIWDQIKHVSTLEIATLAGWFYLMSQSQYGFSLLLLIFASAFLFIILIIIRRQAQLQDQYRRGICSILVAEPARKSGPLSIENFEELKKHSINLRAYVLARSIPCTAILGNIILFLLTSQISLPKVFPDSVIAIAATPVLFTVVSIFYLKHSTSILKKLLVN